VNTQEDRTHTLLSMSALAILHGRLQAPVDMSVGSSLETLRNVIRGFFSQIKEGDTLISFASSIFSIARNPACDLPSLPLYILPLTDHHTLKGT